MAPEAYMKNICEGQNKQTKITHTHQPTNCLQWFLNEACSADVIVQQHNRQHPLPATQERNTQVVSIIYLQSLFPSRHSSDTPEEGPRNKHTGRGGGSPGRGEAVEIGTALTKHQNYVVDNSNRTVFLC